MSEAKDLISKLNETSPLENDRDFIAAQHNAIRIVNTLHHFQNILQDLPYSKHNSKRTPQQELEWLLKESTELQQHLQKMASRLTSPGNKQ